MNSNKIKIGILSKEISNLRSFEYRIFDGRKKAELNFIKKITSLFKKKKFESDGCSDLYIYLIDSLNFNKIMPHKFNPVLTDSSRARNAGPIFSYENKIFRPSRINNKGVYGKGININEIVELSLDKYEERIYKTYLPDFNKKYIVLHHIHYNETLSVFDLCRTKK